MINSVLQSQQAIEEIDIVGLLNYYTTLMGDQTDLNQFRKKPAVQPGIEPGAETPGTPEAVPNA